MDLKPVGFAGNNTTTLADTHTVVLFLSLCVRPAWRPGAGAVCRRAALLSGSGHAQRVLRLRGDADCGSVSVSVSMIML